MATQIQAIRGMNDILPDETPYWQFLETILRETSLSFGYQEIRFPNVEKTELFKRSIGEATDIVEKEMYTFLDRNNDSLTLRPEGTACCVRAGIEHGLLYHQIQRLWYLGPYFRHERPQKGRYRQFHQFGAETFGLEGPDIDAEMILLSATLLHRLGLSSYVTLELNSLGSLEARNHYRESLVTYFEKNYDALDEDSKRRLTANPLRILDSKNPDLAALISAAPKLIDYLDDESATDFEILQTLLKQNQINFKLNPCLVRGLDYYSKTVFEWTTTSLGAQGTICAGGRYDGLVEQLGGKSTPAIGFALGLERTVLLLKEVSQKNISSSLDIYFITDNNESFAKGLQIANEIRAHLPHCRLVMHCGGGNFKNQFKKADKSGARLALILGENELVNHTVTVKYLREDQPQQSFSIADLLEFLPNVLMHSRLQ